MGIVLNEGLSQISLIFIYAAMAVYTAAFLTFASHLSRLASDKKKVRHRRQPSAMGQHVRVFHHRIIRNHDDFPNGASD
ncbi:MAG: hypothetical protein RL600_1115 [Actinomycetota bacterium]